MQYIEDPATGERIIRLSDSEAMNVEKDIIAYVGRILADKIIEKLGDQITKEALKKREVIVTSLQTEIVKKSMEELNKKYETT